MFFLFFDSLQNILCIRTLYTSILFKHFKLFNQHSDDERKKAKYSIIGHLTRAIKLAYLEVHGMLYWTSLDDHKDSSLS